MRDRKLNHSSQLYSPFLEEIMLACAARDSTSKTMQSAGTVFAQRAKATLVHYLQDPTIAVVQGLILLGAFEVTTGNVNLGWTFHGKLDDQDIYEITTHTKLLLRSGFSDAIRSWPTSESVFLPGRYVSYPRRRLLICSEIVPSWILPRYHIFLVHRSAAKRSF